MRELHELASDEAALLESREQVSTAPQGNRGVSTAPQGNRGGVTLALIVALTITLRSI